MASSPITSWQIEGGKVETVTNFIFLGSKITVNGDCSHKIKRCLLLGRKATTNLDRQKQRHHFANKDPYSQSYGFSSSYVHMWELDHEEGWAPKTRCFRTVVVEKTLESPLDSKEIKPINPIGYQPWYLLEGLRLKLQHFGHLMGKANSLERPWCLERLRARGAGGNRGWDGWRASLIQWTWIWANSGR